MYSKLLFQLCMLIYIGCTNIWVDAKGFDQFGEHIDDGKCKLNKELIVYLHMLKFAY